MVKYQLQPIAPTGETMNAAFIKPDYGYAAGPFTRVAFCVQADRGHVTHPILVPKARNGLDDAGSLVTTLLTLRDGVPTHEVFTTH